MKKALTLIALASLTFTVHADVKTIDEWKAAMNAMPRSELITHTKHLGLGPVILLDIISKVKIVNISIAPRQPLVMDVAYALDKGYGYSIGPFTGALSFVIDNDGGINRFALDPSIPEMPTIKSYYRRKNFGF